MNRKMAPRNTPIISPYILDGITLIFSPTHIFSTQLHSSISWLDLGPGQSLACWYCNSDPKKVFTYLDSGHSLKWQKLTHQSLMLRQSKIQISPKSKMAFMINNVKQQSSWLRRKLIQGFPQLPWPSSNQPDGHSERQKEISSAFSGMIE